jgi:hypothetical protein
MDQIMNYFLRLRAVREWLDGGVFLRLIIRLPDATIEIKKHLLHDQYSSKCPNSPSCPKVSLSRLHQRSYGYCLVRHLVLG